MILAIDVGNTQTVLGSFQGDVLDAKWRISTDRSRTADEYRHLLRAFLADAGLPVAKLRHVLVSSVVPAVTRALEGLSGEFELFVAGHDSPYSFANRTRHPETVGPDRLVNVEAALRLHGAPLVIVDCGTATTFDVVSSRREYLGGAIAPGVGISAEALFHRASRLASVELRLPARGIGDTTETAVASGILLGHAAMIDGMVGRLAGELARLSAASGERGSGAVSPSSTDAARPQGELGEAGVKAIGTGGWMEVLAPACSSLACIEPDLTLLGLKHVWENVRRSAEPGGA